MVKKYHSNKGPPKCTLKIDLMKAYDSVHWGFVFDLLVAIGTPHLFVKLVKECVSTAKFSVSINGGLEGYF